MPSEDHSALAELIADIQSLHDEAFRDRLPELTAVAIHTDCAPSDFATRSDQAVAPSPKTMLKVPTNPEADGQESVDFYVPHQSTGDEQPIDLDLQLTLHGSKTGETVRYISPRLFEGMIDQVCVESVLDGFTDRVGWAHSFVMWCFDKYLKTVEEPFVGKEDLKAADYADAISSDLLHTALNSGISTVLRLSCSGANTDTFIIDLDEIAAARAQK